MSLDQLQIRILTQRSLQTTLMGFNGLLVKNINFSTGAGSTVSVS